MQPRNSPTYPRPAALPQEHGVERLYYLEREPLQTDSRSVVFLVRPSLENMQMVALQVRALSRRGRGATAERRDFTAIFVPRRTMTCEKARARAAGWWRGLALPADAPSHRAPQSEPTRDQTQIPQLYTARAPCPPSQVLEEEGVYGDITFAEVELGFVPAERDLLLLEAGDLVRDVAVEGDTGEILHVARALQRLQAHCGTVPFVKGKGPLARQLCDVLLRLRREKGPQPPAASAPRPQIDALIVLDRSVDLVTPLCTQLTYEGLCDEILRIVNGAIELPSDSDPTAVKKVRLNSSDALFHQLRDLDFGCDSSVPLLPHGRRLIAASTEGPLAAAPLPRGLFSGVSFPGIWALCCPVIVAGVFLPNPVAIAIRRCARPQAHVHAPPREVLRAAAGLPQHQGVDTQHSLRAGASAHREGEFAPLALPQSQPPSDASSHALLPLCFCLCLLLIRAPGRRSRA